MIHAVLEQQRPMKNDYQEQVVLGKDKQGVDVHKALALYESFHHLSYETSWGTLPWPCSCPMSHAHCECKAAGLVAALSDPEIKVPYEFVEPSNRKKCKRMKGTAGPKRIRILAEQSQEKQSSQSKIPFMEMEGSGSKSIQADVVIPEVEMSTSSDNNFMEVLCK